MTTLAQKQCHQHNARIAVAKGKKIVVLITPQISKMECDGSVVTCEEYKKWDRQQFYSSSE